MRRLLTRMLTPIRPAQDSFIKRAAAVLTKVLATTAVVVGLSTGLPIAPAVATEVADLYQSQVTTGGRTPAHQRQAMAAALREVAMKVSGRSDIKPEQLQGLIKNAEKIVQSYAYEGDGRGEPLKMRVAFDGAAVNAGLQAAGLPVWSSNRPKVLLWLVREDAGQRRIVTQELDTDVLDQVRAVSRQRGLPFHLPLNDVQDMQSVSAADVWAGFLDNVKLASGRYHPDIIVLAKVYQAGLLWQGDWQIVAVGGTHSQEFTGPDMASVIEPGIGWITQDIASVYANRTPAGEGTVTGAPLTFRISGVRTLKDYARLLDYLKTRVVVKQVTVREVAADTLTLAVTSDAHIDIIMQTLKAEGRLVALPSQPAAVVDPVIEVAPALAVPADTSATDAAASAPAATDNASSEGSPATPVVTPSLYEFEWHG